MELQRNHGAETERQAVAHLRKTTSNRKENGGYNEGNNLAT